MICKARRVEELEVEVERLRTALKRIQEWDYLNPPDPKLLNDLPWLRRTVDDALAGKSYDMLTPRHVIDR